MCCDGEDDNNNPNITSTNKQTNKQNPRLCEQNKKMGTFFGADT